MRIYAFIASTKRLPVQKETLMAKTINEPHTTSVSFEFFPPKTPEDGNVLHDRISALAQLHPSFVSVTSGAMGSNRNRALDLVTAISKEHPFPVMPHLTCVGETREELRVILEGFKNNGIDHLFALRGDPPEGEAAFVAPAGGFSYAGELVELAAAIGGFTIGVAGYPEGHPETPDKLADLEHLKRKVDAGADFIITQLFFDNRDFYDFRERCYLLGIRVPIYAGIMPILSEAGVKRMCSLCGSRIPAPLFKKLRDTAKEDVAKMGTDWAIEQCQGLVANNVSGIHFYTLNRSNATTDICKSLDLL